MRTEIEFISNPIHTTQFENTLHKVFSFDRINKTNYSLPGAKYLEQTYTI
jgi:hypothetical protein